MGEGKDKHSDPMQLPTIPSSDNYDADPEVCSSSHLNLTGLLRLTHGAKLKPLFMQVWDLIVVGAGVAGAALAYRQGQVRNPLLQLALMIRPAQLPDCLIQS
jgi:hypothetical protein